MITGSFIFLCRENLWDLQSKPRLESSDLLLAKRACAHIDWKPLGSTQNTNTCLYKESHIPEAFPYLYIFQSSHMEEITIGHCNKLTVFNTQGRREDTFYSNRGIFDIFINISYEKKHSSSALQNKGGLSSAISVFL